MAALNAALRIKRSHWDFMQAHVASLDPEEACGLVAAQDFLSQAVYRVENMLHSPTRFRMEAQGQIDAFLEMENNGWELAAIYHSHPAGPLYPSPTDMAEFAYPGVPYLIWSKPEGEWICAGYWIGGGYYRGFPVSIIEEE